MPKNKKDFLEQNAVSLSNGDSYNLSAIDDSLLRKFSKIFLNKAEESYTSCFSPDQLDRNVSQLLYFISERKLGEIKIRSTTTLKFGLDSNEEIFGIETCMGDRPFVVDTIKLALAEMGFSVAYSVVLTIFMHRDSNGRLLSFETDAIDGEIESITHFLIRGTNSYQVCQLLIADLYKRLTLTDSIGADFLKLKKLGKEIINEYKYLGQMVSHQDRVFQRVCTYLDWLLDGNLVLFGASFYSPKLLTDANLGSAYYLTETDDNSVNVAEDFFRPSQFNPKHFYDSDLIKFHKNRNDSLIYQTGKILDIMFRRFDDHGDAVGGVVFHGLLTQQAMNVTVSTIPIFNSHLEALLQSEELRTNGNDHHTVSRAFDAIPIEFLLETPWVRLKDLVVAIIKAELTGESVVQVVFNSDQQFVSAFVLIPQNIFTDELRKTLLFALRRSAQALYANHRVTNWGQMVGLYFYLTGCQNSDLSVEKLESQLFFLSNPKIEEVALRHKIEKEDLVQVPFKGLDHYKCVKEDADFFCGRERERDIILSNLMSSRLTLLYGATGVGKTSLLHAGVIYKLNEIAKVEAKESMPEFIPVMFRNWSEYSISGLVIAIKQHLKEFIGAEELNRIIDLSSLKTTLKNISEKLNTYLLVILDQFEQYFPFCDGESGDVSFVDEFAYVLNQSAIKANFLVSIREDNLSKLDLFKPYIPNILNNRLSVKPINFATANKLVKELIKRFNKQINNRNENFQVRIESALIDEVLKQVSINTAKSYAFTKGGLKENARSEKSYIEATLLQMVMFRLWNEEAKNVGIFEGGKYGFSLRLETLKSLGGAKRIVKEHLNGCLARLYSYQERIAAAVFHYLVTPSGNKIGQTNIDLAKFTKFPQEEVSETLKVLSTSNNRILRSSPSVTGEIYYEIFHDILCEAILDWTHNYGVEEDKEFKSVESIFGFACEGKGEAFFRSPKGVARGHTRVHFDEFGNSKIEMSIEQIESEYHMELGAQQFFSGQTPWRTRNSVGISLGGTRQNPCEGLVVKTEQGIFRCGKKCGSRHDLIYGYTTGSEVSINLSVSVSQFDFYNTKIPKYWVLPLVNFISDFVQTDPALENHPMRISPRNGLIIFEFNNAPAFIEPLNDYEKSRNELIRNKLSNKITAIMVGEVGKNPTNTFGDLKKWFPFEFLSLIDMASGVEVGFSKLHLYDKLGKLVRYMYLGKTNLHYVRSKRIIDEYVNQAGTGYLLTKYVQFKSSLQPPFPLISVVRNLFKIAGNEGTVEDKFLAAVRAFASLNNYYGYEMQLNDVLQENQSLELKKNLKSAGDLLRLSAKRVKRKDLRKNEYLNKMASILESFDKETIDFGLSVYSLIRKFELKDITVMDEYYKRKPRGKKKNWSTVLSEYFNIITKQGYFDTKDVGHVFFLCRHLHDIIVRIIFKTIGYEGTYQPLVVLYERMHGIDANWVKATDTPDSLGYQDYKRF